MKEQKKCVPEIRFAGFTDDWEQRKLGEVVEFFSGLTYSPQDITNETGVLVLRSSNVQDNRISSADNVYVAHKVVNVKNVQVGDIIVVVRNGSRDLIGKHALINNEMKNTVIGAFMTGIRSSNSLFINALLSTPKFISEIEKNLGATINQITIGAFKSMEFNVPSQEEQTAIGNFFKQLDDTIALHQRTLEKYQKLKISYLEKMFPKENERFPELRFPNFTNDWEQRKLGDISQSYSGGTPSVGISSFYGGSIPFIRSGEINDEKTELFLTEKGLRNSSAKLVKYGNILYALYGATSGEVNRSKINGAINQAILAIIPNLDYCAEFIAQWLRKNKLNIISTYLQGGQGNLSAEIVKNLQIILPNSKEEQTAIGNFFKQFDDTIALHQREVEKYKKIKQAYLEKMFI